MLHAAVCPSLPASGVTHTVSGCFFGGEGASDDTHVARKPDVVVIRQNNLTLYRATQRTTKSGEPAALLEFVVEVSLHAPPIAAAVCKPEGSPADVLVLLLDDYRISVIRFNVMLMQWDTLALVQLDDRVCAGSRCSLDPVMRVDPTGTYIAVLVKRMEFFLFPLLRVVSKDAALSAVSHINTDKATAGEETAAGAVQLQKEKPPARVALNAWDDDDDDDDNDGNGDAVKQLGEGGEAEEESAAADATTATTAAHSLPSPLPCDAEVTRDRPSILTSESIALVGPITHVHLHELKDTIRNVRDFQFVESTSELHLAFLCEKYPTWAGRVKLVEWESRTIESHMLTCSVMWVRATSADTDAMKLLAIGEVDSIPFNVTHMTPVPSFEQVPSAVLCCGRNTLVHVGTKSGYGCYFNQHGRDEVENCRSLAMTYEAMRWADATQQDSTELTRTNLNLANCVVIPILTESQMRLLLISEEQGTVVEVEVCTESYTVSQFIARIIMTGCHCSSWASLGATRYFLGSANGDSRVVAYSLTTPFTVQQSLYGVCPIQDADAVDSTTTLQTLSACKTAEQLAVEESCRNSPYATLYSEVAVDAQPQIPLALRRAVMDLAVCSGLDAAGAVCVLRNSIRNHTTRTPEELNAVSVFFLAHSGRAATDHRKRARDEGAGNSSNHATAAPSTVQGGNAHLLLTGTTFTILFSVGSRSLQQVRGTVFNVGVRTVFAAELPWCQALVQVTEGELRIVAPDGKRKFKQLMFADAIGAAVGKARAACLDTFGKGSLLVHFEHGELYRLCVPDTKSAIVPQRVLESASAFAIWKSKGLVMAMQGPDLVLVDSAANAVTETHVNFSVLPPAAVEGEPATLTKLAHRLSEEPLPHVAHMHVYEDHDPSNSVGLECTLVLITSSGELMSYRVYRGGGAGGAAQGDRRRLIKDIHHLLDVKAKQEVIESVEARKLRLQRERASLEDDTQQVRDCSSRIIPFDNIGCGLRGVYVCGQQPVFLIHDAARDYLVPCRHQTTGAVRGFSPFTSLDIVNGYVYCSEGYVHFAPMQAFGEHIGNGWWMQRIPLGVTPHRIVYSAAARGCFVVTSAPRPYAPNKAPFDVSLRHSYDEEGNKFTTVEEATRMQPLAPAPGMPMAVNEQYRVELFSCGNEWERCDVVDLEENEQVLSAQCIELTRSTSSSLSSLPPAAGDVVSAAPTVVVPVCVLATSFPLGEDTTTRGRLIVLAASTPGDDSRKQRIKIIHSEPMRGPATSVTGVQGDIAVAVGGTIRVLRYDWVERKMETMAMHYAGAYVTHLSSLREYLLVGDLYQSVALTRYSAANHTITLLGRDANALSVVQGSMLYHGRASGLVVSDADRNVVLMGYTPRVQDRGGDRAKVLESLLTVDGEYRIPGGSMVKMLRVRSPLGPSCTGVYVTNAGEIGFMVPLGEQTNRTGQWIARRLQGDVVHCAGLTPKVFLGFSQDDPRNAMSKNEHLLHAPLLHTMFSLDLRTRKAVAAAALTDVARALNVGATLYAESSVL